MSEFEWRRRLAQLPREREPDRDLWPGIAKGIGVSATRRRRRPRWLAGLALAASLGLVTVLALRIETPMQLPAHPSVTGDLLLGQAESLAQEYRQALSALGPIEFPAELADAVQDIDRSLIELHTALQRQPEADFLLDRLRKTYAQRLRLSQRLVTDWT